MAASNSWAPGPELGIYAFTSPAGGPHALKNLDLEAKLPGEGAGIPVRHSSAAYRLYKLSGPRCPHPRNGKNSRPDVFEGQTG